MEEEQAGNIRQGAPPRRPQTGTRCAWRQFRNMHGAVRAQEHVACTWDKILRFQTASTKVRNAAPDRSHLFFDVLRHPHKLTWHKEHTTPSTYSQPLKICGCDSKQAPPGPHSTRGIWTGPPRAAEPHGSSNNIVFRMVAAQPVQNVCFYVVSRWRRVTLGQEVHLKDPGNARVLRTPGTCTPIPSGVPRTPVA